jgi:hypothetical protein
MLSLAGLCSVERKNDGLDGLERLEGNSSSLIRVYGLITVLSEKEVLA